MLQCEDADIQLAAFARLEVLDCAVRAVQSGAASVTPAGRHMCALRVRVAGALLDKGVLPLAAGYVSDMVPTQTSGRVNADSTVLQQAAVVADQVLHAGRVSTPPVHAALQKLAATLPFTALTAPGAFDRAHPSIRKDAEIAAALTPTNSTPPLRTHSSSIGDQRSAGELRTAFTATFDRAPADPSSCHHNLKREQTAAARESGAAEANIARSVLTPPPEARTAENEQRAVNEETPARRGGLFASFAKLLRGRESKSTDVQPTSSEQKPYYDDEKKRWIFPGDPEEEAAAPLAPPPTTSVFVQNTSIPADATQESERCMGLAARAATQTHQDTQGATDEGGARGAPLPTSDHAMLNVQGQLPTGGVAKTGRRAARYVDTFSGSSHGAPGSSG
ncbi:hypothetical protein EON66_11155, partial [archaeon]